MISDAGEAVPTHDVRALDAAGFGAWLARHLERWRRDPVFAQRARIRDLRRDHPRLRTLERARRLAHEADQASAAHARLRELERDLAGADQAIAGLTAARDAAGEPSRRAELAAKLTKFSERRDRAHAERARLEAESPERRALRAAEAALAAARAELELDAEEARLEELLRARGQRAGRTGASFEDRAVAALRERVLPALEAEAGEPLRVLRGVTLGAARTELDALVVRPRAAPGEPVEVLAVVEAKRNPNDLAHGFRMRQENLAWLTGEAAGYDPAALRTRAFPTGHFDRPATHRGEGAEWRFTRDSFRRFRRDPASGLFLDGLVLASRAGTLWGMSGAALGRLAHRAATDAAWSPDDPAYLAELHRWTLALTNEMEALEVLRLLADRGGVIWVDG